MASVFPQMRRNSVGTRALADERAFDGVGKAGATRLAKRRDVIDVDVESLALHCSRTSLMLPR